MDIVDWDASKKINAQNLNLTEGNINTVAQKSDTVFQALEVDSGSYTGEDDAQTISTDFTPDMVFISGSNDSGYVLVEGPNGGMSGHLFGHNLIVGDEDEPAPQIVDGGFETTGFFANAEGEDYDYTAVRVVEKENEYSYSKLNFSNNEPPALNQKNFNHMQDGFMEAADQIINSINGFALEFEIKTYEGGGDQSIDLGFPPDLVWIFNIEQAGDAKLWEAQSFQGTEHFSATEGARSHKVIDFSLSNSGFILSGGDGPNNDGTQYLCFGVSVEKKTIDSSIEYAKKEIEDTNEKNLYDIEQGILEANEFVEKILENKMDKKYIQASHGTYIGGQEQTIETGLNEIIMSVIVRRASDEDDYNQWNTISGKLLNSAPYTVFHYDFGSNHILENNENINFPDGNLELNEVSSKYANSSNEEYEYFLFGI